MDIIIIDDDADDLFLFCKALKEVFPEANCVELNNCLELSSVVRDVPSPDVVLIDMHMSPLTGKECFLEVKRVLDISKSKIVIYSGGVSPTDIQILKDLGADAVLFKGTDYKGMIRNIEDLLKSNYHLE